ncbi:MAG: hypothetical protein J6Z82_00380 [Schwartzia sp.]|nr:hypothetical protein [Schwartzia sp. (in: firmicutes)]
MIVRNLVGILATLIASFLVYCNSTTVFASMPAFNRFKEGVAAVQGVWYDLDGNEAFSAVGDSFNGKKILSVTSYGGNAIACNADFCVRDENGEKTSYIDIAWTANRKYLMVNGNYYRNTKEPEYYESVRGVFLGMKREDVLPLLGEPTKNVGNRRFVYPDMEVNTSGGMVVSIFLPHDGARLDGSGLGADDAPEDFAEAYDFPEEWDGKEKREIGNYSEYLQRKGEMLVLSMFQ